MGLRIEHLKDLKPDPANARKHGPRNVGLIVDALHEVGAARSIVIDEQNVVLAGNATVEAAAEAGITKVQVVDADGQTVIAVRRHGLTPQQKARLALYDNRTAELAEGWNVDVLAALQADGVTFDKMWTAEELENALQAFQINEADAPMLSDGDRAPFRQMTFTVHDEQFEEIEAAIKKAKSEGGGQSAVNENSNGNALAWVCGRFNRG